MCIRNVQRPCFTSFKEIFNQFITFIVIIFGSWLKFLIFVQLSQTIIIMKKLIPFLLALCLASCSEQKSAEDIFAETSSGVVVVLNEFYYQMRLPNGNNVYFTGIGDDGSLQGFTDNVTDAANNPGMLTGTAFFIKDDGTLLTNRHVVDPVIDRDMAKRSMRSIIKSISDYITAYMQQLSYQYDSLEQEKTNCQSYDDYGNTYTDYEKLNNITNQQTDLQQEYSNASSSRDNVLNNLDISDVPITAVCKIGIAYNNTFVTTDKDFIDKNPCVVTQVSDKDDVDLALLELKDKKTPSDAYIFKFAGDKDDESFMDKMKGWFSSKNDNDGKITIDQQLYMMGYNAGLVLANTKQGIKVQMTSGKVTQLPDGQRLLYSIPTMKGSSGSPVLDEYGKVVAVNFAKLNGTDNFNFGIPLDRIKEFLKK
jgi:V8-like Glu-specific endopeptidase